MSASVSDNPKIPEIPEVPDKSYFRIGEAADVVGVKPYVLRYWETEFSTLAPDKSRTGQRVYKKQDIENFLLIKHLLYSEGYSIEGARKRIRELRREGELQSFKDEKVLGGADQVQRKDRVKKILETARTVHRLAHVPVSGFFKL